jgi:hypothetical protein
MVPGGYWGGRIDSELTMNSQCTHWVNALSPPVIANIPRRDTMPYSRGLCLHSGTLGAQVHNIRNIQRALVDHGYCMDGLVRAGLDREGSGVLSGVRDGHTPSPGVGGQFLYRELASKDVWETNCKR